MTEEPPNNTFLDSGLNYNIMKDISSMLARYILGDDQRYTIECRYSDLKENFNAVTYDEHLGNSILPVWKFSNGLTPYKNYKDTTSVPISITHPLRNVIPEDAVISLDFPIWFNLDAPLKVMIVAQDPMPRNLKYYDGCHDAICSSTFGLHYTTWRSKHYGGKRLWSLISSLTKKNIGVYITDCHKFYCQSQEGKYIKPSRELLCSYKAALCAELGIVNPALIVTFGCRAKSMLNNLTINGIKGKTLNLPHFSGRAQNSIKKYFNITIKCTIESQTKLYADEIIKALENYK